MIKNFMLFTTKFLIYLFLLKLFKKINIEYEQSKMKNLILNLIIIYLTCYVVKSCLTKKTNIFLRKGNKNRLFI